MQNKFGLSVEKTTKNNIKYSLAFVLLVIPVTSYADFSFASYPYTLTNLHTNNLVDTDSYYTIDFTPVQTGGTINSFEYINDVWTPVSYTYTIAPNTGVVESTEIIRNYNISDITGYFHNLTSSEITAPDPLMYGFINVIAGDFVGNTQEYKAGALTNSGFTINNVYGDFINNLSVGGVNGAAITNRNNGNIQNIIGNFVNNESLSQGGAIVNDESTITNITANFINNFVSGEDILITNSTQSSNSMQYCAGDSFGGAIYNTGNITTISGDFISNNVNSYKYFDGLNTHGGTNAIGGAILNGLFMDVPVDYSTNVASIDTITGRFVGNSATVTNTVAIDTLPYTGTIRAYGGAISNSYVYGHNWAGIIQSIQADFNNNFVEISNESSISVNDTLNINAYGGAIYNYFFTQANNSGLIDSINGNFVNNKALINNSGNITTADVIFNASGGAIYNNGHINNVNGDFISNNITINNTGEISTTDVAFDALGGAIYNYGGQINVSGNFVNNNVVINANMANVTSNAFGGAIYNGPGQINLNATNNNILFSGNSADSGGAIYNATYGFITMNISENRDITFATTSDDIHNDGTVTVSGDGDLYLQSVSGDGTFIINNNTHLENTATLTQNSLRINSSGALYANANSLNVSNIVNGGELHLTGGTLSSNISWQNTSYGGGYSSDYQRIYIEGDVLNEGVIAQNSLLNGLVIISGNSFTTNTNNIGVDIVNYGEVILTGGTLITNISGGDITINGTVNSVAGLLSTNNAITNNGTLNITGGNLQQNVTGGNTIIAQNATTSATSFGNLELNGVMNVGTNTVNMANADINGTINLGISVLNKNSNLYTGGHIIADDIVFGDNAKLSLTITDTNLQKGDSTGDISLISTNGDWSGSFGSIFQNNNRYSISFDDTTKTFAITHVKIGADVIAEAGGTNDDIAVASAWDDLPSSTLPNVQRIIDEINHRSQHDTDGYLQLIKSLQPVKTNVVHGVSRSLNNAINTQITERLTAVTPMGRNGGDTQAKTGIWAQGMYNKSNQSGTYGFDGNTIGVIAGFDTSFGTNITMGAGYAFSTTDVEADMRNLEVDGHNLFIYSRYQGENWHVNANLSYGMSDYTDNATALDLNNSRYARRIIPTQNTKNGGTSLSDSEYSTNTIGASALFGYNLNENLDVNVGTRFNHITVDDYIDMAGQSVSIDDMNFMTVLGGFSYGKQGQNWTPVIHIAATYDVLSDDYIANVDLGGSGYVINGENIDPFGIEAGISLETNGDIWDFSIGYDIEWHSNFISHTGKAKLKYNF